MKEFQRYLEENNVNSDDLQQAANSLLAQKTDYLPIEDMRERLIEVLGSEEKLDEALYELEKNPLAIENTSLAYLYHTAEVEPDGEEQVKRALSDAGKSLPVIEIAILATAAMYISYLYVTKGVKEESKTVERLPDGSYKETTFRKLYGPTGPLAQVGKLLGFGNKADGNNAE
jgi:hypothetical protein